MLRSDSLDRERDDLLGFAICALARGLADLAHAAGGVGLRLFLYPVDQLALGFLRGHARELLQAAALLGDELLHLLTAALDGLFALDDAFVAARDLALPLLDELELALEDRSAVLHALLLALDLLAALLGFCLPLFAEGDQLFLPRDDRALSERLGFAAGIGDYPLSRLFCRVLRGAL